MPTEIFYRKADVSAGEAINELLKRHPKATLEGFETRAATKEEARSQGFTPGTKIFAASVKLAEEGGETPEPPKEEESSPEPEFGGESESKDDPEDKPEEKSEAGPPKPKAEGDGPEGPGEPKKLSPEEETNHLLKQILDAIQGGGIGGPGDDPLGDLGAPAGPPKPPHAAPAGPPLGPGGPGGPAGHGGPPLPPPVDKGPGMAFSHYDPRAASFSVIRKDASELGVRGLKAEAEAIYPTHNVARLVTAGVAEIDGYKVDLADNNIAVLTLTKKG